MDDFKSVIRLFGQGVSEEIKLFQEGEFGAQEGQELIQIPQLVVGDEEGI
jgi:hypothetical protein